MNTKPPNTCINIKKLKISLPITAHVAEDNGKFELKRQLSPQVLEGESEKDYIKVHQTSTRDIQVASDTEALSQLYTKTHDGPPTRVYGAIPLTPDIMECLIQDQPINMLGMLQSVWTLLCMRKNSCSQQKRMSRS